MFAVNKKSPEKMPKDISHFFIVIARGI
jgi:hypothetical protein